MTQRPPCNFYRSGAPPWVCDAAAIFLGMSLIADAVLITIFCWDDPAKHRIVFLVWGFSALGILLFIRWLGRDKPWAPKSQPGPEDISKEQADQGKRPFVDTAHIRRMRNTCKVVYNILGTAIVVFMIYGIVRFPDFPIHPLGGNMYCDKLGHCHTVDAYFGPLGHSYTAAEYHAYVVWDRIFFWGCVPGLLAVLLLARKAKALGPREVRRRFF